MVIVSKYLLAGMFALNTLCLGVGVVAAAPGVPDQLQSVAGAARDDKQDQAQVEQDKANAIVNAKQDEQVQDNTAAIATLSGDQTFILQLIGIFMPLLSLLATGFIAYFQFKAKHERQAMAEETRSNLGHMGRSINGMKSELVAAVKAAAFAEGVAHAADTDADTVGALRSRAAQLAKEAADASERADRLADEAVREIEAKPANGP